MTHTLKKEIDFILYYSTVINLSQIPVIISNVNINSVISKPKENFEALKCITLPTLYSTINHTLLSTKEQAYT